jgi:replicative DNA helicase
VTCDEQAERMVVGALLLAAEQQDAEPIARVLGDDRGPALFTRNATRTVAAAMAALWRAGRWPTLPAVTDELRRRGVLDGLRGQVYGPDGTLGMATGAVYVTGLVNGVWSATLAETSFARLQTLARRRVLVRLAAALVDALDRDRPDAEIAKVVRRLQEVTVA